MFITVRGKKYRVHIPAPYPFAISGDQIIGITPTAPCELLDDFEEVWDAYWDSQPEEDKEWTVNISGRDHQVLRIGERFLCDCWPFRKTGDCKHIAAVLEECLI